MRAYRRTDCGVTLLEVLVAIAVLAVVGAVIVGGVFVALKGNDISRTRITAEGLSRTELEYVKAVQSDNWTAAPWYYELSETPVAPPWNSGHTTLPTGYSGYSITVCATQLPVDPYSNNDIQRIVAMVRYKGGEVLSIDTYLTR
jgi:prepilin-type N-terminal cleavage/methylation domain-containing protein